VAKNKQKVFVIEVIFHPINRPIIAVGEE